MAHIHLTTLGERQQRVLRRLLPSGSWLWKQGAWSVFRWDSGELKCLQRLLQRERLCLSDDTLTVRVGNTRVQAHYFSEACVVDDVVDLSKINLELVDDPALVHAHSLILMYENEAVIDGYDRVCHSCSGEGMDLAHRPCAPCGGARRTRESQ